jgi:hypothetical protein
MRTFAPWFIAWLPWQALAGLASWLPSPFLTPIRHCNKRICCHFLNGSDNGAKKTVVGMTAIDVGEKVRIECGN